jgi:D-threo-aldose 1-dehydrogenase
MPLMPRLQELLRRRLGFGGAPLGNLFRSVDDDRASELVRQAFDRGIRYFDTAPHYGNGLSERRLGSGLRGVPRDDCALSSKVGRILVADPGARREQHGYVALPPFRQRWDYSRDGTLRSIDESLRRLGMSRLDIVYVHDIDRSTHGAEQPGRFREAMDGAFPALAELREQGVIGGSGLGVNDVGICLDVLERADIDVILLAGRYTLLDQSALGELFPLCLQRGVDIVAGGVFNSGILATGTRPDDGGSPYYDYAPASADVIARTARIEAQCAEFGVPLAAAALQFPRAHPAVTCVLTGVRSVAELQQNLELTELPLPSTFWKSLREHGLLPTDAPTPGD